VYDVIVIGGGPGGYVAAIRAAQRGLKTALVERAELGGVCLNRGCIPTKALVRSAEVLATVRRAAEFGVRTDGAVALDWSAVQARKSGIVKQLTGGVGQLLRANGVEVIQGEGRVPAPGAVEVGAQRYETRNIILATGSKPAVIPLPPADLAATISSDQALALDALPASLAVIGGGVIGMEFASLFAAFGVKVTVFERLPQIVPNLDPELAQRLALALRRRGVAIHTGAAVTRVRSDGAGRVVEATAADGATISVGVDSVLLAVGRVPEFGGIDLAALGVDHDRRGIKVDRQMRTSVPGFYAVGDVVGATQLAYGASAEGIVAADAIAGDDTAIDYRVVPRCVFTHPELAGVGLTEQECRWRGIACRVGKFNFAANGRALILGETEGLVKVIGDEGGKLLGVHIVGPQAGDLIHEAAQALAAGAPVARLADALLHIHPTLAETLMEAAHNVYGNAIHMAPRRR